MTCEKVRSQFSLMLYGELSFDEEERLQLHLDMCEECRRELARQKAWHAALNGVEIEPPPSLLRECREDLRARLMEEPAMPRRAARSAWWEAFRGWFAMPLLRPAGAMALVALGFFGARFTTVGRAPLADPAASRVKYVEPAPDGRIQIVVDETRQRVLTGRLDDEPIRRLLLAAAKDPSDPGLRAETVGIMNSSAQHAEFRDALLQALLQDQNAGVRLKALEGLKPFAYQSEVRKTLSQVLLTDSNPGLRTQAIDLLTQSLSNSRPAAAQGAEQQLVGVLQELLRKENNGYVRQRCQRALEAMNASVETY